MSIWLIVCGAGAFLGALLFTRVMLGFAVKVGLMDVPNERSSHATPTPRGGGLAIVVASVSAMAVLTAAGLIPIRLFAALGAGGVAVATVGFVDDRWALTARTRLMVHLLAAACAVACIGPVREFAVGGLVVRLGWAGYPISVVGIAWFLNIFNFMDGIDGLAASEATFVCGSIALIAKLAGAGTSGIVAASCAIGSASTGFLVWNLPPARMFMGDVGSGYLGFGIAVLGLAGAIHSPSGTWVWLSLVGVFVVDSTITLIRRHLRGESLVIAHRMHAYQRAARSLGHGRVTASIAVLNLAWLLPCSIAMAVRPIYAPWFALLAYCPVTALALSLGAGGPHRESTFSAEMR